MKQRCRSYYELTSGSQSTGWCFSIFESSVKRRVKNAGSNDNEELLRNDQGAFLHEVCRTSEFQHERYVFKKNMRERNAQLLRRRNEDENKQADKRSKPEDSKGSTSVPEYSAYIES